MGSANQKAYVFVCGQAEYVALSLLKDGANIPPCVSSPHKWRRVDEIPLNAVELTRLSIDPAIAMENLVARGYHIAQPVGDIFPHPAVTVPETPSCDTKARY